MGNSFDWQKLVVDSISDLSIDIYNPRRDNWDSSWIQSIHNPQFYEQVTWELDHLEKATLTVIYFAPTSKSPISLLELGLLANKPSSLVVCCPDGFYRKGNVDIVCNRNQIVMMKDLENLIAYIRHQFEWIKNVHQ